MRASLVVISAGLFLAASGNPAPAQEGEWKAFAEAGWRAARQGDHPAAKELLEKALKVGEGFSATDARRALTRAYLAYAASQRGAREEAETQAREAAPHLDKLPLDSAFRGKGFFALALASTTAGRYEAADTQFRKAIETEEKLCGANHLAVVQLVATRAETLEAAGRFEEAEPLRKRQVAALDLPNDTSKTALALTAHRQTAALYLRWNRAALAEPHLLRIVELIRGQKLPDARLAEALSDLGELYLGLRRLEPAETMLQEALKLREAAQNLSGAADQGELARCLHDLGALYVAQGRYFPAEPVLERALAIREKVAGNELRAAETLNVLAVGHTGQKSYRKAEIELLRALKIREAAFGVHHLTVAATHEDLATVYVRANHVDAAEASLKKAIEIREKEVGALHSSLIVTVHTLANLYRDHKRLAEAEPLYQRVIQARERAAGKENPALPGVLDDYAALLKLLQKPGEAANIATRAAAIRARHPGKSQ